MVLTLEDCLTLWTRRQIFIPPFKVSQHGVSLSIVLHPADRQYAQFDDHSRVVFIGRWRAEAPDRRLIASPLRSPQPFSFQTTTLNLREWITQAQQQLQVQPRPWPVSTAERNTSNAMAIWGDVADAMT